MSGGLTVDGFVSKTVQELFDELSTDTLARVSPTLDLSPDQPYGQTLAIQAEKLGEIWELLATIYYQMDPDNAEGYLLDAISAISGTRRRSPTYSLVAATLNLNASTTVTAGSVVYVAGQPGNRWVLLADVTNPGGSPANIAGQFRSEQLGPFVANSGTLTGIATPTIGWNSVTNADDAVAGIPEDTDAVLRIRRQAELAASGSGNLDSIRADVLEVPGVIQCFVFENTTEETDATGLPPHRFRVVIWDGISPVADDNAIAQAIWNSKPTGIAPFGNNWVGTAKDSTGQDQTILFDRAEQVPIYFSLATTLDGTEAATYRTAVKAAMAAYALSHMNLGIDVIDLAFRAQALKVDGVIDVPTFTLGKAPSPAGTVNIEITPLQIATVDTANILVDGS